MNALRVLHVDDEPDIREVVEFSLSLDPDLAMRSCASGEEALVVAERWMPDIVLLDVMMPVMDGPSTLEHLRNNPSMAGIPVVSMTARAQSRELDLFRSLGAVGVIAKPFDPMTLAASVRAYAASPGGDTDPRDTRLGEIREKFLQRVDGNLLALAGHWSALEAGSAVPFSLAEIRGIAHGLAGAGGIFGFDEIGTAAAALEEAVILQQDGKGTIGEVGLALERVVASAEPKHRRWKTAMDRIYK